MNIWLIKGGYLQSATSQNVVDYFKKLWRNSSKCKKVYGTIELYIFQNGFLPFNINTKQPFYVIFKWNTLYSCVFRWNSSARSIGIFTVLFSKKSKTNFEFRAINDDSDTVKCNGISTPLDKPDSGLKQHDLSSHWLAQQNWDSTIWNNPKSIAWDLFAEHVWVMVRKSFDDRIIEK